jgi:electron transport complex protein RnfE
MSNAARTLPWYHVIALVPLAVASTSALRGLALGLASLLVLSGANLLLALVIEAIGTRWRATVSLLICAVFIAIVELTLSAYAHSLYREIGIYLPLLAAGFLFFGFNGERFSSATNAFASAARLGLSSLCVMFGMGFVRELLSQGGIFLDSAALGGWGTRLAVHLASDGPLPLFAVMPAGGFMLLGIAVALAWPRRKNNSTDMQ